MSAVHHELRSKIPNFVRMEASSCSKPNLLAGGKPR
jgi:hypothetical protein